MDSILTSTAFERDEPGVVLPVGVLEGGLGPRQARRRVARVRQAAQAQVAPRHVQLQHRPVVHRLQDRRPTLAGRCTLVIKQLPNSDW